VDHSTHYRHEILVSLPSPTGAWTAIINEETVEGLLLTSINADVALISKDNPAEPIDLLGVDTSGHAEARPRISWSAPNVLRVTVPNISYLKVLTRHADGVDVDLHFEPDDPAARAAWLKKIGQPPEWHGTDIAESYGQQKKEMSETYTRLSAKNVKNTDLGYHLYQFGRVAATRPKQW
jgi:hypothetical protein